MASPLTSYNREDVRMNAVRDSPPLATFCTARGQDRVQPLRDTTIAFDNLPAVDFLISIS